MCVVTYILRPEEDAWCHALTVHLILLRHAFSLDLQLGWVVKKPQQSVFLLSPALESRSCRNLPGLIHGNKDPNSVSYACRPSTLAH